MLRRKKLKKREIREVWFFYFMFVNTREYKAADCSENFEYMLKRLQKNLYFE